ncbi:MAG: C4-dicarboxylate ABC transporter [Roseovarius sp.]|nr:C4-dicarboxylate ABC transporter [Roseovarius sp.]
MSRPAPRLMLVAPFLLVVAAMTGAAWHYGYRQALDELSRRGEADLALVLGGLISDLQRYRDQAVALADHPSLTLLTGAPRAADRRRATQVLIAAADRTGAGALHFVDREGRPRAGTAPRPDGFARSPAFRRAMDGALGSAHGHDAAGRRYFEFAAPSFGADGRVNGAVIAVAMAESMEFGWRGMSTAVFLVEAGGTVFLTNRSELLGWGKVPGKAELVPPEGPPLRFGQSLTGPHEIWQIALGPYLPRRALQVAQVLPRIGMTGAALVDVAPARRLAALPAGALAVLLLFFGALLLMAQERRRALARANAQLERRVAERTERLTRTNRALHREIRERQEAEAALRRAQAELVQAGKLGALGKMSAGISHELSQPLMAIRQFAANGGAFLKRGAPGKAAENLARIDEMAHRMDRIIRNLRAFVRNENEPMGRVDMVRVVEAALEMTAERLESDGIALDWRAPPGPVLVRGGEVRLGQVLVNLITNAADAMAESAERRLAITLDPGAPVRLAVRDTGPGIEEPEKIFDPFYTTKDVGREGMGLGLSISYGLVQSFGGRIAGTNTGAGAVFTVELDPWPEERAA